MFTKRIPNGSLNIIRRWMFNSEFNSWFRTFKSFSLWVFIVQIKWYKVKVNDQICFFYQLIAFLSFSCYLVDPSKNKTKIIILNNRLAVWKNLYRLNLDLFIILSFFYYRLEISTRKDILIETTNCLVFLSGSKYPWPNICIENVGFEPKHFERQ